jgi:Alpha amylase, catalytic domain
LEIHGANSPVGVRLDDRSGLPTALLCRGGHGSGLPVAVAVTLVTGGNEHIGPKGALRYAQTTRTRLDGLAVRATRREDEGETARHVVSVADGGWELDLEYRFAAASPHVALGFTVRRAPGAPEELLRDVELTFSLALADPAEWVLNAPGNMVRCDLPVEALDAPLPMLTSGDVVGSPGIVALSNGPATAVLWPVCETEIGALEIVLRDEAAHVTLSTGLAGHAAPEREGLTWRAVHLDWLGAPWPEVSADLSRWHKRLGIQAPGDVPDWIRRAHIYEAHVGFSVFHEGHRYERYATVGDLHADLPRIQELGFDVVQLMPRHPYPSYNVHDYADVTTSYGDEDALRELVAECHRRGIRVLLDVIMHGVIDKEIVDETVTAVLEGPFAQRLGEGTIDYMARSREDVAWARHIVEYAPYWREGSPDRHPLADERPEWFMRDSAGTITRRYTKAFDIAHPGWQRYFVDACVDLVERLGVDGYRVDAPTYNAFASWADGREHRPSYGPMASLGLLRDLRDRLRELRPDIAVYTEPTGGLFRAVADATYNYDEHWLVEALLGEPHPFRERMVRNARELGRWLHDRDAATPPGATIVHHIDSHDSIWWRLPGAQFRRERFGRDAAIALLAVFAFGGGAFMTFMGGEDDIEDELRRAHDLRRRLPAIAEGTVDRAAASATSDDVLTVLRESHGATALVAVNVSAAPVGCEVAVRGRRLEGELHDHWNDEPVDGARLRFAPFQPRVLRLS